jgi:hypothetical protein
MNRSVIQYTNQLDEGIIGKVGGHLKRNAGKYLLGAATVAAGGIAGAKGALGSTVQGGVNAARGMVNTGLSKVAASGQLGNAVVNKVNTGVSLAKKGVDAGISKVATSSQLGNAVVNKVNTGVSLAKKGVDAGVSLAKQGVKKGGTALVNANSKIQALAK